MIVAVLLPSTGRAEQMKARANDLLMQPVPDDAELWLVLAPPADDAATINAGRELASQWQDSDVTVILAKRDANTTAVQGWNAAYEAIKDVSPDWLVLGADDIIWRPGWLANALAVAEQTGAQVVGLNDGHTNLRHYGAHYMVAREFAEEHLGGFFIPPAYSSWWFDREVCEKAAGLGLYAPAWNAVAEHTHPDWGNAAMDDTYQMAWPLHEVDRGIYEARKVAGWPVDYRQIVAPPLEKLPELEQVRSAVGNVLAIPAVSATDAALKLARERGLDLAAITGTGTDGRIIKADVEAAIK